MAENIGLVQQAVSNALNADADNYRKQQSSNALVQQYGPAYADPAMAAQAANANHQTLMTPIQVQAGQQQNVLNTQQITQGEITTNQAQQQERTQQLGTLLTAMDDARKKGIPAEKVFDSGAASAAQLLNIDPAKFAQHREQYLKDPEAFTESMRNQIGASTLYGMKPADRAKFGQTMLETQKTAGEIDKNRASTAKTQAEIAGAGKIQTPDTITTDIQNNNFTIQRVAQVPVIAKQMTDLVGEMSSSARTRIMHATAKIPGTEQPVYPGSPEYKFTQLAAQLGGNLSLDDLRNSKAAGVSLGRVTNTEFTKFAEALVNPNLANIDNVKGSLAMIRKLYGEPDAKGNVASGVVADLQKHDASLKARLAQAQANPAMNGTPAPVTRAPNPMDFLAPRISQPQQPQQQQAPVVQPGQAPAAAPIAAPAASPTVAPVQTPHTRVLSNDELLKLYLPKGK